MCNLQDGRIPSERQSLTDISKEMAKFASVALLVISFLVAICSPCIHANEKDYFDLISDVAKHYRQSGIFFLYKNLDSFAGGEYLVTLFRKCSKAGISAAFMDIDRLDEAMKYHRAHFSSRPMIVVLLNTRKSITSFEQSTKTFDMPFPIWLLIFMSNTQAHFHSHLRNRIDNVFHLTFHSRMLVACHNDHVLYEWYALGNESRIIEFASWKTGKGLMLKVDGNLHRRRGDLEKQTLRVVTVINHPFVFFENGVLSGIVGDVLFELSRSMNFQLEYIKNLTVYGKWDEEEERWTGAMGLITTGQADIGAGRFLMTSSRADHVAFTIPVTSSRGGLFFKRPDGYINWLGCIKALSPGVWTGLAAIIIAAPLLLILIERTVGRTPFRRSMIGEKFLRVLGVFCQQGLPESPRESQNWSTRLTYLTIGVAAILVYAAYGASLMSNLTVPKFVLPFTTMEEFAEDRSYKFIVFRDSGIYEMFANSKDPVNSKIWSKAEKDSNMPRTLEEGFQRVRKPRAFEQTCQNALLVCTEKVAFYATNLAYALRMGFKIPCEVTHIRTPLIFQITMALPKNSPYKGLMNYHIQKYRETGLLASISKKYRKEHDPSGTTAFERVSLWSIATIFFVLAGAVAVAILILIYERNHHRKNCIKQRKRLMIRRSFGRMLSNQRGNALGGLKQRNRRVRENTGRDVLEYLP